MFLNYYYYHHHSLSLVSFCHVLSLARPLLRVAARLHHQGNVAAGINSRAQPSGWMRYADVQKRRRVRCGCIRGIPR